MPGALIPENPVLAEIPDVEIDNDGRFKYILCKIYEMDKPSDFKLIVRGTAQAEFHSDIYDDLDAFLEQKGIACECLGGGKIKHDSESKKVEVFGNSQGYGKANHSDTCEIITRHLPNYTSITWSDS